MLHSSGLTETIVRAQAGNPEAFEHLYRENAGRIFAVCLRMLGSRQEAEETTQQAFVRAWTMIGSFRGESTFSSWLHRLAVNVVLGEIRTRRRRESRIFEVGDVSVFERASPPRSPELGFDLEGAIRTLPDQARAVFVLHDIEGYTHEEIAGLMGTAVGTCKAQLHRARKLLRQRLEK